MITKSEIVQKLSERFKQLTPDDVKLSTNIILEEIGNALKNGHKAEFRGFGTFSTFIKSARVCRNPKTGEVIQIKAKVWPHFKPSAFLNKDLNKAKQQVSAGRKIKYKANDEAVSQFL